MILEAWQINQASYTVGSKPTLLPKIKTLFFTRERQVLHEQPEVIQEVLESWEARNPDGEQAWIPASQMINQQQARQLEVKTQRCVFLSASAIAAVLVTVAVILVWK
jgi:hypothetical protein